MQVHLKAYSVLTLGQARAVYGKKAELTLAVILSPLFTLLAIASFGVARQLTETWWGAALSGFIPACIFMGIAALLTTRTGADFIEVLRRFWLYNIVGYDAWLYLDEFLPEELMGGTKIVVVPHNHEPDLSFHKDGRVFIVIPLGMWQRTGTVMECGPLDDKGTLGIKSIVSKWWRVRATNTEDSLELLGFQDKDWHLFHRSCQALAFLEEYRWRAYMRCIAWHEKRDALKKKDEERELAVNAAREKHIKDLVQTIFLISNSSRLGARKEAKELRESLQRKLSALLPEDDPRRVYCTGRVPARIPEEIPA
jgi:hypothetical protein